MALRVYLVCKNPNVGGALVVNGVVSMLISLDDAVHTTPAAVCRAAAEQARTNYGLAIPPALDGTYFDTAQPVEGFAMVLTSGGGWVGVPG